MAVVVEARVACSADVETLFDVVSDTDRLNRESGFPPIEIAPSSADGTSRQIVRGALGPLAFEYAELPWEWERPSWIHVRREYSRGLIRTLDIHFEFEPKGQGTEVGCRFEAETKASVMAPALRVILRGANTKMARTIARIDAELSGRETALVAVAANRAELLRAEAELLRLVHPEEQGFARRLVAHVGEAADAEVVRIRPFDLADRWGEPRRQALEVCLNAVVAGLLELNWDLICPSCRIAAARVPNLSEVEGHGYCHLCDLSFGISLDQAVEATFLAAPAIRRIRERQYCTGGPAMTPHVVAQCNLQPGKSVELRAPRDEGRYRLFVRGGATVPVELSEAQDEVAEVVVGDRVEAERIAVRPGGPIRLTANEGALGRHLKLERMDWSSQAATAHLVSTLPAFRRRFSEELLRPGIALRVTRASILFSDLSASTALYTREGDAAAFGLVQDHFELLQEKIEENEGVIVKTIGDAVMASFVDEVHAVRAAVAMQRAFPAFRETRPEQSVDVYLKIGVYSGPCYAVSANGLLDYFGQTVNVAARLQGQAHDAEIVMTEAAVERAQEAGLLEGMECDEAFSASLKGVDPAVRAIRMRVGS